MRHIPYNARRARLEAQRRHIPPCEQLIQIDLVGMQFLQDVVSRWRLKNSWADSIPFHQLPRKQRLEFFEAAERLYYACDDWWEEHQA